MMVGMSKNKFAIGLAFMITMASSEAHAFGIPLLCMDIKRLISSVRVTMQQVMIIKQEIDSNMRIIKEIQNGGFAAAGAMIFDKIQNGDYDRFGQALSTMKEEGQDMAANAKSQKAYKAAEEEAKKKGLDEKSVKAAAEQARNEELERAKQERIKKNEEAKANRGSNAFKNSYDWLKNNSGVTEGASSALRGLDSGNWGQALSGAAGATGGAINSGGESTVGNVFNDASYGAGNALNSALSGDWGNAFNSAAQGAGSAVGGSGSQGLGTAIGAAGAVGSGVYDVAGSGGNLGETISNIANNGQINSGLAGLESGYGQMQDENKAAAEAQRKQAEEIREKNQKAFDEYMNSLKEKEAAEKKATEEKTQKMLEDQKAEAKKECQACRASKGQNAFECSFKCGIAGM